MINKSGWQRSADEAGINFMIKAGVTIFQTKIQVANHNVCMAI